MTLASLPDFVQAGNIGLHPALYLVENRAIDHSGQLDEALFEAAPWQDKVIVDLGCGTGFWLTEYGLLSGQVIGVEPDPALYEVALAEHQGSGRISVLHGSAEHLPLGDDSADIVHARFAYFWGDDATLPGLAEVARVLRPGGTFVMIDNAWSGGDFADILRDATTGVATIDPDGVNDWWTAQGARTVEVDSDWTFENRADLEAVLRMEFPDGAGQRWLDDNPEATWLSYRYALRIWQP